MSYIRILKNGKPQVIKDQAFCDLLNNNIPEFDKSYSLLFDNMDSRVYKEARVTKSAMSNVHGDWYEWLLAISAWNYCAKNTDANLVLLMPNISQFDVASLYTQRLHDLIVDLRNKVEAASDVKLITSNPDFVIIDRNLVNEVIGKVELISSIRPTDLAKLNSYYKSFENLCEYEDIIGYIAAKKSLRPDRRLQIPHEGSLMKAIYKHLQTREWIINPIGLKYYAFTSSVTQSDVNALRTVATHSITTVSSLPEPAVDGVYEVDSTFQAFDAFRKIL